MALFIISIPLMLSAVAIAVIPLLAMCRSQHRPIAAESSVLFRTDAPRSASGPDEPTLPLAA
jgi:hypothetical protein